MSHLHRGTTFVAILFTALFLLSIKSNAITFAVTNLNDSGAGSLRQAIIDANANIGPDVILFDIMPPGTLPGTITLSTGGMDITDSVTITGPGADLLTIDADNGSRIFLIDDGDSGNNIVVSISGLMLINGFAGDGGAVSNLEELSIDSCVFERSLANDGRGGAIYNVGDIEGITNCTFSDNISDTGGGAVSNDNSTIQGIADSTFSGNRSDNGGAISNFNRGTIGAINNSTFTGNFGTKGAAINNDIGSTIEQITSSTFSGNLAGIGGGGGAIFNTFSSIIGAITNSTFSGNNAEDSGGAIYNTDGGTIEQITNSTFSGNVADEGGAVFNDDGTINISFTTIAGNAAAAEGGGLFSGGDESTRLRNSILADNSPGNCAGIPPLDRVGNYSDDDTCEFDEGNDASITLGPLADNGGPTQTRALLDGDPLEGATEDCDALDSEGVPTGMSIGIDQRSFTRPFGPDCDSGAYEAESSVPEVPEEPEGPPGPSGSSCAVVGNGDGNGGLGGLLVYALIPLAIIIRKRSARRAHGYHHMCTSNRYEEK